LERDPEQEALLQEAFRLCHTIKGDSRTVGFDSPNQIAHLIEDVFDRLRSGEWQVEAELISALLEAVDLLGRVIRAALVAEQTENLGLLNGDSPTGVSGGDGGSPSAQAKTWRIRFALRRRCESSAEVS
jgi:chemotaxis protein histidine kinase CheA